MNITVSICTITYNHERYISYALDSFISQITDFDFEIIVADDASVDGNQEIIKKYQRRHPDKIQTILRKENVGFVINWIDAINKCRGHYIAICEGDDYWIDPFKLQKQVKYLDANPDFGMVYSDIELHIEKSCKNYESRIAYFEKLRKENRNDLIFGDLLTSNKIYTLSVCVRAELLKNAVMFPSKKWFLFDYYYWLCVSSVSKVHYLDYKTAAYRIHSAGVTNDPQILMKARKYAILYGMFYAIKKNKNNSFFKHNSRALFHRLISMVRDKDILYTEKILIVKYTLSLLKKRFFWN